MEIDNQNEEDRKRKRPLVDSQDAATVAEGSLDSGRVHKTEPQAPDDENDQPSKKAKVDGSSELLLTRSNSVEKSKGDNSSIDSQNRTKSGAIFQDKSLFPAQLWSHIFSFLPPLTLGRLLQVNKRFNLLLCGSSEEIEDACESGLPISFPVLTPNQTWGSLRKRFLPDMPKPLLQSTELQMLQLIFGSKCQICGKDSTDDSPSSVDPWASGPGENGVRIIWPYGARLCGQCLLKKTERDFTLLMSSSIPSHLLSALPFIFVTSQKHVLLPHVLETSHPPSHIQTPEKRFYKPQIDSIRREFEEVKSLGVAAVEEWIKGLEAIGLNRQKDALRLDRWESKGGLQSLKKSASLDSLPIAPEDLSQNGLLNGQPKYPGPIANLPRGSSSVSFPPTGVTPTSATRQPFFAQPPGSFIPASKAPPKAERSLEQVNQAKLLRKQEIEKRCALFDPPIPPNILAQMDSFQAAIQISTPLTDSAWDVLKPRLLSQLEIAEEREKERIASELAAQQRLEERKQQESQIREARENQERDWDEKQAPIRAALAAYADEAIEDRWNDPDSVSKDTCPDFAADVLLHVRERFYENIREADAAAKAAGKEPSRDPPIGPPKRKLILENMKWVYDTKIKSRTEAFRKELFLCHDCKENTKYYGFEGVVQHFAAKHTSALSVGPVVVHWRAEWPERSPFHPKPGAAKANNFGGPQGANFPGQPYPNASYSNMGPYSHNNGSLPHPGHPNAYPPPPPPEFYGSRGPYSHPPPPPDSYYSQHRPQSQHPSSQYIDPGRGYPPGPPPYEAAHSQYQGYYNGYPGQSVYGGNVQQQYRGPGNDGRLPPYNDHAPYRRTGPSGPPHAPYSHPAHTNGPITDESGLDSSYQSSHAAYKKHLEEMAIWARELWTGTSDVRGLPMNVRMYVLIHHVRSKFQSRFNYPLGLSMFAEGVETHHMLKAIKLDQEVFTCRTCQLESSSGYNPRLGHVAPPHRSNFLGLLKHFQSAHVEPHGFPPGGYTPLPDWTRDMIALPEESVVAGLVDAVGMDDRKLKLISQAFPNQFPYPLPKLGPLSVPSRPTSTDVGYDSTRDRNYRSSVPRSGSSSGHRHGRMDTLGEPPSRGLEGHGSAFEFERATEDRTPKPEALEKYGYRSTEYDPSQSHLLINSAYNDRSKNMDRTGRNFRRASADQGLDPMKAEQPSMEDRENRETSYDPREYDPRRSGLVSKTPHISTDRMPISAMSRNPRDPAYPIEDGSEDGEVGPASVGSKNSRKAEYRAGSQREAEQFLQGIEPGNRRSVNAVSTSNSRRRDDPVSNWQTEQSALRPSRLAVDQYDSRPIDEPTGGSEMTLRPPQMQRDVSYNSDNPSSETLSREYEREVLFSQPSRVPSKERTYVEIPVANQTRSHSGQHYADRNLQDDLALDRESSRHYGSESYGTYASSRYPPPHAQDGRREDHTQRITYERAYRAPQRTIRAQPPIPPSEAPIDVSHFIQVPVNKEDRTYIEESSRTPSYRPQYLVAEPPEPSRQSRFVAMPAEYSHYEKHRGKPVYVEHQRAYTDNAYEKQGPSYYQVKYD